MTNYRAAWDLMWEYSNGKKLSFAGYKRIDKALKQLAIVGDERDTLLNRLGFYDHNHKPHEWLQKKIAQ